MTDLSPYQTSLTHPTSTSTTTKRLKRIGVLKMGIFYAIGSVIGVLIMFLIYLPFILIGGVSMLGEIGGIAPEEGVGVVVIVLIGAIGLPIMYGVIGFVAGIITAVIYNLIAKFSGGLEFDFEDVQQPPY